MERVVVAMSGGVDSSLAAALILEAGYEAVGVTMKLLPGERPSYGCCGSTEDMLDAKKVCGKLGIRHYAVPFEKVFDEAVLRAFAEETRRGRTPNPCVECNRRVKFGALLELARRLGARRIATGHYARVLRVPGEEPRLLRGADDGKDQSYFLYALTQKELRAALFPVGEMSKLEVRDRCRELELPTADKPQSQDLCFSPSGLRPKGEPGDVRDSEGRLLGRHCGLPRYTVGQRKGLGLGKQGNPRAGRMYVTGMDLKTNTLVVGESARTGGLRFLAGGLSWTRPAHAQRRAAGARIRYRAPIVSAELVPAGGDRMEVRLGEAQRAIAPGQACVFYDGNEVLGGGTIEEAL